MFSIKFLFGGLKKLGKYAKDAALKVIKKLWKKIPLSLRLKLGAVAFFAVLVIGVIGFFMTIPNLISDFFNALAKDITAFMIDNNLFGAQISDLINLDDAKKFEQELIDKGIEVVSMGFKDETKYDGSVGNGKYVNLTSSEKEEYAYSYLKNILVADLATYCLKDKGGIINIDYAVDLDPDNNTKSTGDIEFKSDYMNKSLTITDNTKSGIFKLIGNEKTSTTYNMEGWTGKYGLSKNFLIALHLSTLSPDFIESIIDEVLPECEVNLGMESLNYTLEQFEADSDGNWNEDNPIDKQVVPISMPLVASAKNWYKTFDFSGCYKFVSSPEVKYYKYDTVEKTLEPISSTSDESTVEEEGNNANKYSDLVNNLSQKENKQRKEIIDTKDEHTDGFFDDINHSYTLESNDDGTVYFKCHETIKRPANGVQAAALANDVEFGTHTHKLGVLTKDDTNDSKLIGKYKCAICDEIVESQIIIYKQTLNGYYTQIKEPEIKKIKDITEEAKEKYGLDNYDEIQAKANELQGYKRNSKYDSESLKFYDESTMHLIEHFSSLTVNKKISTYADGEIDSYKDKFGNVLSVYDRLDDSCTLYYMVASSGGKYATLSSSSDAKIYCKDSTKYNNGIIANVKNLEEGKASSIKILKDGVDCIELYNALKNKNTNYDYNKAYKAFHINTQGFSEEECKSALALMNSQYLNKLFYSDDAASISLGNGENNVNSNTLPVFGEHQMYVDSTKKNHGYICKVCAFCDKNANYNNDYSSANLSDSQIVANHKMILKKEGSKWTCMVCNNDVSEEIAKNVPDDCKIDLSSVSEDERLKYTFKELFDRQYVLYDGTIKTYYERTQEGTNYIKVAKTLPLAFSILETSDNAEDQIILRDLKEFMADEGFYYSDSLYDTSDKLKTTFRWIMPNCMPNTQWPSSSDIDGMDNLIDGNLFAGKSNDDLKIIAPEKANVIKVNKDAIALRFTSGLSKDMTMIISGINVNSSLKATNSGEDNYSQSVKTNIQTNYETLSTSGSVNGGTSFVEQGDVIGYAISGKNVRIRLLNQNGQVVIPSDYMTTIDLTKYDYIYSGGYYYPSFEQFEGDWAEKPFRQGDSSTIHSSGCGATSFAMVASGITYSVITPDQVANYMPESTKIGGSSYAGFQAAAQILGLKVERKQTGSHDAAYVRKIIDQETSQGRAVIAVMTNHFFVILPSTSNVQSQVYVLDPANIIPDGERSPQEMVDYCARKDRKLGSVYYVISK